MADISREQLDQMRATVEEKLRAAQAVQDEIRKDMEALERVDRMLAETGTHPSAAQHSQPPAANDESEDESQGYMIDAAERVVLAQPMKSFTSRIVYKTLLSEGYPLPSEERALVTIGTALKKLADKRRTIRMVKRGSGRKPNIYRAPIIDQAAAIVANRAEAQQVN